MMVRGFTGTGGILTPLHGCRTVTWSLSAVVKIALRMTLFPAMVAGLSPRFFCPVTHSRTCIGRMSIIRMLPNSGMRCLYRT
jgi:hypothetical protein